MALLIVGASTWAISQCPVERLAELKVNCSHRLLQKVPDQLPNHTDILILDHNNITLQGRELQRFDQLKVLSLSGNGIHSLPSTVFSGLGQLKILHLTNNSLSILDDQLFIELLDLREIYLDHNKLQCLHDQIFGNLTKIKIIDFSHNYFRVLNGEVIFKPLFDSLIYLSVSHNLINFLSMPYVMHNLKTIDASHNLLQSVAEFYSYELESADFSHNNISKIFLTVYSQVLVVFNVSYNIISSVGIEPADFEDYFTVDDFLAPRCQMTKVNVELFYVTRRNLDLSGNDITLMYRHAGHPDLPLIVQSVNLANNPSIHMPIDLARGLKRVRQLDMSGTNIGLKNFTLISEILKLPDLTLLRLVGCNICELAPPNFLVRYFNVSEKVAVVCDGAEYVASLARVESSTRTEVDTNQFGMESLPEPCLGGSSVPQPTPCPDVCFCFTDEYGPALDCTDNNIEALVPLYTSYTEIRLQYNHITYLNETLLSGQTSLLALNLSHNSIAALPVNIFKPLNSLSNLDLSHNHLTSLPEDVFKNLTGLQRLFLEANNLTFFSEHLFSDLTAMRELHLGFDKHLELISVDSFQALRNIKTLYITHCGLRSIQTGLFRNTTNLKKLHLDHNRLRSVESGVLSNLHQLIYLDLSNNLIETVENEVFQGTNLENLYLNNNRLKNIQLNYLDNVFEFSLSYNLLISINFSHTQNIFILQLNNNELSNLDPNTFKGLSKLRVLDLSNNPLHNISHDLFRDVSKLGYLNLANTSLTFLPTDVFSNLELLENLILDQNNIQFLTSADFRFLEFLNTLSLSIHPYGNSSEVAVLNYKNITFIDYLYSKPNLVEVNLTGHTICQQIERERIVKYLFVPLSSVDICSG
ncbi:chondroadherin-like protein isoform X2 [Bacillus rossius redtenbacheri]